jgi:hypothetical protein
MPITVRTLERADALNELLLRHSPFVRRRNHFFLDIAKVKNVQGLTKMRQLCDLTIDRAAKDTGVISSLLVITSLVSLAAAAAVLFSYDDIKKAVLNRFFIYFSIQAIYGLANMFPVLAVTIRHNQRYNKVFASIVNDRIFEIASVVACNTISSETREEMVEAMRLLKALHDSVVEHPKMLKLFGVPVTPVVYTRLLALTLSLAASELDYVF